MIVLRSALARIERPGFVNPDHSLSMTHPQKTRVAARYHDVVILPA
jgi:hypothetical protein